MTDQLTLVPKEPPTLTYRTIAIGWIEEGEHPPVDPHFVQSIRDFGIIQPPVVRQIGQQHYRAVDGRRRIAAERFVALDDTTLIPVFVLEGEECSPDVLALLLNEQRSANPVSDLRAIEQLVAKGVALDEIAAAVHMSKATVEKRMRLANLIVSWRGQLDTGKLKIGMANRLANLSHEMQGQLFIHFAEHGTLTSADIDEITFAADQQQATMTILPEPVAEGREIATSADIPALVVSEYREGDVLLWAQKQIAAILVALPSDAPHSVTDSLAFAATILGDLGESQQPGFVDDPIDLSDVEHIDDTPYDEDVGEEAAD